MFVPVDSVELDKSGNDWHVQIGVFDRVGIHITFKYLEIHQNAIANSASTNINLYILSQKDKFFIQQSHQNNTNVNW